MERRRHVVPCWMPKTGLLSVLNLLFILVSTTAAAFNGVPGNRLNLDRSGHWTINSRGIRNDPGDDPQWPSDGRSTDEDSRGRLERQVREELRETFGDEFCRQLEEESEIINSVHEQKARVGREASCSPTSPLASTTPKLPLNSLHLPPSAGEGRRGGREGTHSNIAGPMADWLR